MVITYLDADKVICERPAQYQVNTKRVVSLFSGCGGMDLGIEGGFVVHRKGINEMMHPDWIHKAVSDNWVALKPTSFQTVFANDISRAARAAWIPYFERRHSSRPVFRNESIVNLVKISRSGDNSVFPGNVDLVTGGFPCQDFSIAGRRKGLNSHRSHTGKLLSESDEPNTENRGALYIWMRDVIDLLRPKMFIAENVKGISNLSDVVEKIVSDFRNVGDGYIVLPRTLNAADYGVPQARHRILFYGFSIAALNSAAEAALISETVSSEFEPLPPTTHSDGPIPSTGIPGMQKRHVTVGDVIGDLPEPEMSLDHSHVAYSKARWYGTHCQGQTEVNLRGLGPTIRAEHHGNIEFRRLSSAHGGKNDAELKNGLLERRLTLRECGRIQTFPDDFELIRKGNLDEFNLSASDGYRLVGNAVPPLLAHHIARRLEQIWPTLFLEVQHDSVFPDRSPVSTV